MNPFLIEVRPCELRREGHHLISATALHRASELADMEHLVRTRIAKALKKPAVNAMPRKLVVSRY